MIETFNKNPFEKLKILQDFEDENKFYRIIVGDEAFQDISKNNVIRTNSETKSIKNNFMGINLNDRPVKYPSFSKGKVSISYADTNPNHYIIVTGDESLRQSTLGRHGKGTTFFPTDDDGNYLQEFSGKNVQVYKHEEGKYKLVYQYGEIL